MQKVRLGTIYYVLADYITAVIAWLLFVVYRKTNGELQSFSEALNTISSIDIRNAFLVIPAGWILLHYHAGSYFSVYRKSRLQEITRTVITTFIGTVIIFFIIVVNDNVHSYSFFTPAFFSFWLLQFLLCSIGRSIVLQKAKRDIKQKAFSFTTLIIGGSTEAVRLYKEIVENSAPLPNKIVGFVTDNGTEQLPLAAHLPLLGSLVDIESIVARYDVQEVLIAIDSDQHHKLQQILIALSYKPTVLKISPDLYDIISGTVRTSNVLGAVLIEIYPELMPDWQRVIKRTIDVVFSSLVILIASPLYLFAALRTYFSSPGDIIFKQERIGLYGKQFFIYKFRSMYANAEQHGPALSKEADPRITKWGKVMRKWRIDEIPQFYNVLIGEMSLVGPRPERLHFINQICETHPHYRFLHKVKPGLSSWGMVKFGYASTVQEMKDRMKYDLLYIKNCSLALDAKIMFYTILVILQGRGK
jgi:polysaccharide biosynthesis protein PslA